MEKRRAIKFLILALTDYLLLILSFYMGYKIRLLLPSKGILSHIPTTPLEPYKKYLLGFLIWIVTFYYEGLYTQHFTKSEELVKIIKATTIASAFSALLFFTLKVEPSFSRLAFFFAYLLNIVLLWLGRIFIKRILYLTKIYREKALFWGDSPELKWFNRLVQSEKNCGIEIVDHIRDQNPEEIKEILENSSVSLLFVGGVPVKNIKEVEDIAWRKNIEIVINAFNHILNPLELEVYELFGFKSLKLKYNLLIPRNVVIKRVLEVILTLFLTILLLPAIILIALLVKLTSKGPIFYLSERLGKDGKLIKILKFRTMYTDSDKILKKFLEEHPKIREEYTRYRAIKSQKDPRVTPLGRILRKLSLDELPQLFNILKGDMSLVGPRPYLPEEVEYMGEYKNIILSVKPGLTGMWQVSGRNELTMEERVMLDVYYVTNWSIPLDMVIFVKTILEVFKGTGAY